VANNTPDDDGDGAEGELASCWHCPGMCSL